MVQVVKYLKIFGFHELNVSHSSQCRIFVITFLQHSTIWSFWISSSAYLPSLKLLMNCSTLSTTFIGHWYIYQKSHFSKNSLHTISNEFYLFIVWMQQATHW